MHVRLASFFYLQVSSHVDSLYLKEQSRCTHEPAHARSHTHTHTGEEAAHSVWAMMHQSVDNLEMAHDRKGKWRETRVYGCVC